MGSSKAQDYSPFGKNLMHHFYTLCFRYTSVGAERKSQWIHCFLGSMRTRVWLSSAQRMEAAVLTVLESSGFNWETLPQWTRCDATKEDFCHQPQASTSMYIYTYANTHVYLHAYIHHTNVLYVLSVFIQFSYITLTVYTLATVESTMFQGLPHSLQRLIKRGLTFTDQGS